VLVLVIALRMYSTWDAHLTGPVYANVTCSI
jgi:hypothetical protein